MRSVLKGRSFSCAVQVLCFCDPEATLVAEGSALKRASDQRRINNLQDLALFMFSGWNEVPCPTAFLTFSAASLAPAVVSEGGMNFSAASSAVKTLWELTWSLPSASVSREHLSEKVYLVWRNSGRGRFLGTGTLGESTSSLCQILRSSGGLNCLAFMGASWTK